MFGGHMKRIGIMGTAIMSLLLAAGVPGHAQQDQPNGKQDQDQKDENRGRPERSQNRPQPSRGEEPRPAERNRGQMQREEQQQHLPAVSLRWPWFLAAARLWPVL